MAQEKTEPSCRPRRERAIYTEHYRVSFEFKHAAVLHVHDGERRRGYQIGTDLFPSEWQEVQRSDVPVHCWITFESIQPFNRAECDEALRKVELLDAACEAMVTP